jgi:hypothetical protein
MESYDPSVTPVYTPGDDVVLRNAAQGWDHVHGKVVRVVPIAPLSHQARRYLYVLDLDGRVLPVLTFDDELMRAS